MSQFTAGAGQDYRVHRMQKVEGKKAPSRSTLRHETVTQRLILITAGRNEWLPHLPDTSTPHRGSGKVVHRVWFSPEEFRCLYSATRQNIQKTVGSHPTGRRRGVVQHVDRRRTDTRGQNGVPHCRPARLPAAHLSRANSSCGLGCLANAVPPHRQAPNI